MDAGNLCWIFSMTLTSVGQSLAPRVITQAYNAGACRRPTELRKFYSAPV